MGGAPIPADGLERLNELASLLPRHGALCIFASYADTFRKAEPKLGMVGIPRFLIYQIGENLAPGLHFLRVGMHG